MSALLSDDELRAWAKQVKRALFDTSITKVEGAALVCPDIRTRKPRKDDSPFRPHGDYLVITAPCASWTRGQRFTIELYRDGRAHLVRPRRQCPRDVLAHLQAAPALASASARQRTDVRRAPRAQWVGGRVMALRLQSSMRQPRLISST